MATRRTAVSTEVLGRRALNRAFLARQHLLARTAIPVEAMIEHLVGMQAQNPLDPYVALWSRLEGFLPDALATLIIERRALRMGLLRTTLHLVTDRDALWLYPIIYPVLARAWTSSPFVKRLHGTDVEAVVAAGRAALEEEPRTLTALGNLLHERWPDRDPSPLAYAARFLLPIVQLPPRGVWNRPSRPPGPRSRHGSAGPWAAIANRTRRCCAILAAFGPASVSDIRTWSWLTGLGNVVERIRPLLVTFRDEAGRELFDLPDAPRPNQDTPAPPRFLPAFDNLLLSHQDRSRVFADSAFGRVTGRVGTFLVDGFVRGQWQIDNPGAEAVLILEAFDALADVDGETLLEEGSRLLEVHAPAATRSRVIFGIANVARPGGRTPALGRARAGQRSP